MRLLFPKHLNGSLLNLLNVTFLGTKTLTGVALNIYLPYESDENHDEHLGNILLILTKTLL